MAQRPPQPAYAAAVRRRRFFRYAAVVAPAVLGVIVLLDHVGCFGFHGDDWSRFDGRRAVVRSVSPRGTLIISTDGRAAELNLLGLADAEERDAAPLAGYLSERVAGANVTVRLEPLQTRDASGRLLGYAYLAEGDCLNVDVARAGSARVDRQIHHSMRAAMEAAEADAHKHARGVSRGADK